MAELTTEQLTTEQTQAQSAVSTRFGSYLGGGAYYNPLAIARWNDGTFWTLPSYSLRRFMLSICPTLALVKANRCAPIVASYWTYKAASDDISSEWVDQIAKVFDPIRERRMSDILRGQDQGWAGFEMIWDSGAGETRLMDLKPLLPEYTTILVDKYGHFAGIQNGASNLKVLIDGIEQSGLPAPLKAWIYTYDREAGNYYGKAWVDRTMLPFKSWMCTLQQLQKLLNKQSGTQLIGKAPAGQVEAFQKQLTEFGSGTDNALTLPTIMTKLASGASVDMTKLLAEVNQSIYGVEQLDRGNNAPTIEACLDSMAHDEAQMFAAGQRSPRTGMESEHGSRADSEQHTDTATLVAENDDDDIASQLQSVVDAYGRLNFAGYRPGDVFIECPSLIDSKATTARSILVTAINSPTPQGQAIAAMGDWKQMYADAEIPMLKNAEYVLPDTTQGQQGDDPSAPPANNAAETMNVFAAKSLEAKRQAKKKLAAA